MGYHLLEALIPAVISALLLWEGVQSREDGYRLDVLSQVTVQDGLCVYIQCSFTYAASRNDRHALLYGYWYVENKHGGPPHLVATNDPEKTREIDPRVRHRFKVSGLKLNVGDCSLTINDAEAADQGAYHFRIVKGSNRYSYSAANEKLYVTVIERKLDVTFPGLLRAGQSASIVCKTQRCPSLAVPNITWSDSSQIKILKTSLVVNQYSVESHLDFIPAAEDHQQNVTCKVTYGEESSHQSVKKTVTLSVYYPPRLQPFNVSLQAPDGRVRYVSNVFNNWVFARVDESLLVRCEADANPPGRQIWRNPNPSTSRLHISNNKLKLSGLRAEDNGNYKCEARNQEGASQASFYLRVAGRGTGTPQQQHTFDYDNIPTPEP